MAAKAEIMTGSEALEALERVISTSLKLELSTDSRCTLIIMESVVKAALANTPVQCGPERPVDKSGHLAAAPEARSGNAWDYHGLHKDELSRLRAWEQWGREHAIPALTNYKGSYVINHRDVTKPELLPMADDALAALPKEEPT